MKILQKREIEREVERKRERILCSGGGGLVRSAMDGKARERWCMVRYTGGAQDSNELINQTTLRFRPIAPRPVINNGNVSGNLPLDNNNLLLTAKRTKRKYVRVRRNNGYKRKNKETGEEGTGDKEIDLNEQVVTLQLLPERTDFTDLDQTARDESSECKNLDLLNCVGPGCSETRKVATWFDFIGSEKSGARRHVVESWVTVESVVTDSCMETRGKTDVEVMNGLDKDTCPGFISDGSNKVEWVNLAYKRMVVGKSDEEVDLEIIVRLLMKKPFPAGGLSRSYTARVRLQYTWQKENCWKMVPCDVWKMDFGGFAWRLDIEAALSLGR